MRVNIQALTLALHVPYSRLFDAVEKESASTTSKEVAPPAMGE